MTFVKKYLWQIIKYYDGWLQNPPPNCLKGEKCHFLKASLHMWDFQNQNHSLIIPLKINPFCMKDHVLIILKQTNNKFHTPLSRDYIKRVNAVYNKTEPWHNI